MPGETALFITWLVGEALAPLIIAFLLPRPYRLVALIGVGAAIFAWMTYTSYNASLGGDWRPGLDSLSFSAIVALALLLPFWLLGAGIGLWFRRRWNRGGQAPIVGGRRCRQPDLVEREVSALGQCSVMTPERSWLADESSG